MEILSKIFSWPASMIVQLWFLPGTYPMYWKRAIGKLEGADPKFRNKAILYSVLLAVPAGVMWLVYQLVDFVQDSK